MPPLLRVGDADAGPAPEDAVRRAVRSALGSGVSRLERIPAALGARSFWRVWPTSGDPPTLIARVDAAEEPSGRPAGVAPEPPLEPLRAFLEGAGLPVPGRCGGDAAAGIELLEDLGDVTLCDSATRASAPERRALYEEACDLVPCLQALRDPGPAVAAFRRRLDAPLFAYKADLFARHGLAARGRPATPAEQDAVRAAFAEVADAAAAAPARLAHRDLQSANVLVRAGRPPGARLALIDLQGAFLAPPEYDLVCLLRDSYLELPEQEVEHQLARVRPRLPDAPAPGPFAERFDLLTLTRKAKDLARFRQAAGERGDARYLPFAPAALRALRGAARRQRSRSAALARLADLVEEVPETPCAP